MSREEPHSRSNCIPIAPNVRLKMWDTADTLPSSLEVGFTDCLLPSCTVDDGRRMCEKLSPARMYNVGQPVRGLWLPFPGGRIAGFRSQ